MRPPSFAQQPQGFVLRPCLWSFDHGRNNALSLLRGLPQWLRTRAPARGVMGRRELKLYGGCVNMYLIQSTSQLKLFITAGQYG